MLHFPQFAPGPHRYHTEALAQAMHVMSLPSYQSMVYPMPEQGSNVLPAGAPIQIDLSLPPDSYVIGFSAYSAQAAGFEFQIIDAHETYAAFQGPVRFDLISGQGTTPEGITQPVYYLPKPRIVVDPAVLRFQIRNLATVPNTIQLAVWTAEPQRWRS